MVTSRPGLQLLLRAAGTAYLLWLAVHVARSGRPALEDGPESPPGFRTGVLVTGVNPKTWTVALSAASGYSAISADPLVLAAVLAGVFTVVVVPNLVLWCVGGEVLARRLSTDRQWAVLNGTLAALLARRSSRCGWSDAGGGGPEILLEAGAEELTTASGRIPPPLYVMSSY